MLLWLCLWAVSVVLADNDIQPPAADNQNKPYNCADEKVLLKVWTILSNLLDADGQTVKVPSRDQVQYGLTLIKKHILENQGNHNVDLPEKLFLREAKLAKYKGVFLNDNRPLQSLLELEIIPNNDESKVMFKYELPANNNPTCKKEFMKLIQTAQEDFARLANSPVCSDHNVKPWISNPNRASGYQSSFIKNPYNSINNLESITFKHKTKYDTPVVQNLHPAQTNMINLIGGTQKSIRAIPVINHPIGSDLQHVVKLTKDRFNFLENDFTANLAHAKNVADKIRTLYQANMLKDMPPKLVSTHEQLRDPSASYGTVKMGLINNQHPKSVLKSSYVYNSARTPGVNQTYTVTNIVQSQNSDMENGYRNPKTTFINSKYHPDPDRNYDIAPKLEKINPIRHIGDLPEQSYSSPTNVNFLYKYPTSYNGVTNNPTRAEINLDPKTYSLNYDVYRYFKRNYEEKSKALQNEYPYQANSNPYLNNKKNFPNMNQPNINIPQPQLQNYKYTSLSNVQNHNIPSQLTQQALNYNQPAIDILADWLAGTNPAKLNSNSDNNQGEVELTYLVKGPPPVLYQPRVYYIKFRLPYKAFARHLSQLLPPQSYLRSSDVDLYKDLASQFNATVVPSDPSQIPKDISNLEDKRLVKASFINTNVPGKENNLKSVDIINLIKQTEPNDANLASTEYNNVTPNAPVPIQPQQ